MRALARNDYLDDRELRALLAAARSRAHVNARRDHALLALLANTGIRPSEALAMRGRDFALGGMEPMIRVRRLKKRRQQGVIDDLVISRGLARTLRPVLGADLDHQPFRMSVRNLELLFHRYCRLAGLEGFRLYALRHTALTRAWRATKDLRLVQELAGHASPLTTTIYTHVDPAEKRRAAELVGAAL